MIFVTVGTNDHSFDRLLRKIDEMIEKGKIKEEVIIQIGHSKYIPKNAKWFRFETYENVKKLNKGARLIITHGGVGSILTALIYKKPVIAVPRMMKFNEHVDDHQVELVKELSSKFKIRAVFDIDDLEKELKIDAKPKYESTKRRLIKKIKEYIDKI